MTKLEKFIKRNRRRNKHLYGEGLKEGEDYIVCPVSKARLSMIKSTHIERNLGMTVADFEKLYPEQQRACSKRSKNISVSLQKIGKDGLSAHARSVQKATVSRNAVGDDGLTINQRKGRKARATHLAKRDELGRNGYQQLADYRNSTVLDNGLTVQQNALRKRSEKHISGDCNTRRASKASKKALKPILRYLRKNDIKYYFDSNEYGINHDNQFFFFDLVIPSFELAIEFYGKNFHPWLGLSDEQWSDWKQVFTNKSADEVRSYDLMKQKALFESRGYQTIEVYEQTAKRDVEEILALLSHSFEAQPELAINTEYEIQTPHGWCDFKGIMKKPSMEMVCLQIGLGEIACSPDHPFFVNSVPIPAKELHVGQLIDGADATIRNISSIGEGVVFDLVEVQNEDHSFMVETSIHTKNCDEFAFVPGNMAKEFWTAVQPVLSEGGGCIITSTPRTDEDQFAQIWKGANVVTDDYGNSTGTDVGENGFFPIKVEWWKHPDRDEEWAKPFRASLGKARFAQEFECAFVTDEETLIDPMCLSRLRSHDPIYYTQQVRWYMEPMANHSYLVALDPSLGTGGDYSAIQVFILPELVQVAEWQHNQTDCRGQVRILLQILHTLYEELMELPDQIGEPELYWTVENNSVGEAVLTVIEDTGIDRFPGTIINERKKRGQTRRFRKGLTTTKPSKLSACARLKSLIESDRLVVQSNQTIKELKSFISRGASYSAKPGQHDDLVSALLLITRMLDHVLAMGLEEVDDLKETITEEDIWSEPPPIVV